MSLVLRLTPTLVFLAVCTACGQSFPSSRDPLLWPFASTSIWNMPIGSGAMLAPAGIVPADNFTTDEEVIIMEPGAPMRDVMENTAGWDRSKTRCGTITTNVLDRLPVPLSFSTDPGYSGLTPNQCAAILMPDGRTIKQNQPFHVCGAGGTVTTQYLFPSVDIYGEAIAGAHGGAGMSSIGGCIRVGELVPGGVMHHALKVCLYALENYYYRSNESDGKAGYRWPAFRADGYAGTSTYAGTNPELQIGSLLALRPDFDTTALLTAPARIVARSLMDYGAYIIDDAAWSAYYFCTEWGPNGRVLDEFSSRWGFGFGQQTPAGTGNNSPTSMAGKWGKDMQTVFTSLCVVTNNSATSVGGGGNSRRQPLAPDFTTGVRAEGTLLAQNSRTAACSAAGAFIDLRGRLCAAASSGIHFAETSRGARVSRVALLP